MSVEARIFVDTNILVYAYDVDSGRKHEVAREHVTRLWGSRLGILSTQVLQEFYVTVTRKLSSRLDPTVARRLVATYQSWPVQLVDVASVLEAIDIAERHQLSFWDGLIVTAARRAGARRVLSEDFRPGRNIEGVLIENPFAD
ncbi:MAG: PIN domain-containing protein [Chloroflexota bacterium]